MILYRLSHQKYKDDLSGTGAALIGGRWNQKETKIIYTSSSKALSIVEILVHVPADGIPDDYCMISIEIPDNSPIQTVKLNTLPTDWNKFPRIGATQNIGTEFIRKNKFLALQVPSAVVPGEFNYLLNPAHPDFKKVKIKGTETFNFDPRLFHDH